MTNTVSGAVTRFVYNGDGNRVLREDADGLTVYVGAIEVRISATERVTTSYYYAGSHRIALRRDGELTYLHGDHLGSASLATDATGAQANAMRSPFPIRPFAIRPFTIRPFAHSPFAIRHSPFAHSPIRPFAHSPFAIRHSPIRPFAHSLIPHFMVHSRAMRKAPIRIKGLVVLMNDVRERLSAGIPPEHAADFRAMVTDGLRAVETICRQHHITPDDLPAPSRRAYAYLKGLDLRHLPPPVTDTAAEGASAAPKTVRLTGVVATCDRYHIRFAQLTCAASPPAWDVDHADVQRLTAELRADADGIAALCYESGGTPADLPVQSRRAYQWLAFLGDPENLAAHLRTLAEMYRTAQTGAAQKALSLAQRKLPLHIELYATAHLYRARIELDGITITVNEGFIGAPHPVIKALIFVALRHPEKKNAAQVKSYGATDAFEEVLLSLEMMTADLATSTQGQHYDLAVVFDRVNAAYFAGALSPPRLTWNKTLTHRKFGHYQISTDTVMLSLSLDDAAVPPYVVEFVMYHELLHKHLGVKLVNGRRYTHTSEFRDAERRFAQYEQAKAFLAKLSKLHR